MALVECVPNFSEGRRVDVIDALAQAVRGVAGVRLLDIERDADHNRCVLTFVGEPGPVSEAAFRAAATATRLIDMNHHKGEHPRMGATDVVPFVPISGATMEECVALAVSLGQRLWRELTIPVYLYARAARSPGRVSLPDIRRGEYEGLKAEMGRVPARDPDIGEPRLHPTAGATAVGARGPLIAFNVNLRSQDLALAKRIARTIRTSGGGFPQVQARGFTLADRGLVQVSMNLLDFRVTPISLVVEAIEREAGEAGVEVAGSEVIGLIPLDALVDVASARLRLENFKRDQILEARLWS